MEKQKLSVDVWSDIACPWCYVGKRRLEAALAKFPERDSVAVQWHSFELDPSAAPKGPAGLSHAERLAKKYGMSVAQAEQRTNQLKQLAAADGLDMRFNRLQSTNTFNGHRLIHLAAQHGKQDAMKERLMRAYFTEGEWLGDVEALVRLALEVGLDADEVRSMLASERESEAVREDEAAARALGISGVPFFVINRRYGVSGAQSADVLLEVLEKAWGERERLASAPAAV